MKILFLCENYLPYLGGAEVVFKNLAENYVKKGHKVTILTHQIKGTKKKEIIKGVEVIRVPSFHSRYVFSFSVIKQAISLGRKHDVIQTTSFNGAPPAWLAARITGKPVVITVHEIWTKKWKEITGFSWFKSFIHEILEKAIYILPYDKYVCVSNATKNDLIKVNIPFKKVVTVYNGLDYDFWNKDKVKKSNLRQELDLNDNFLFFSWGRPGPTKGFKYLIKAFPLILQKDSNARLLLMLGDAKAYEDRRQELIKLIKKLNLVDKIKVINPVSHEKLRELITLSDCCVIPSTAEGFGYTTVESVTMGSLVVVSNAGSIPEVVSGKHLIFQTKNYFDLADKAIKAIQGKFEFKELKIFPWAESVEKYLSIYSNLCENKLNP